VRVDSGVQLNSEVSIYYDPMIAKLAVWGTTREEAIDRLARALDEYSVAGITTTLSFFRSVVRDAEFVAAKLDTGFIPRFNERQARTSSRSNTAVETDLAMIAAALQYAKAQKRRTSVGSVSSSRWKMSARQALLNEQTLKNKPFKKTVKR
jgi:acetyl/propionyl-CoA carboxylase alpha subunit